jgi:3-polyprenyl-4-hydroxybenzoate decarboxylase
MEQLTKVNKKKKLVVGMSGASGAILGIELLNNY